MCRFSSATNHAGEVKTAVQMQSALHTNQINKCGNNHQLHAERRLIRETRYSLQTNVFVIDQHSRVRKEKPIVFHCKYKTGGGDGGQWRGCQQCTLGKDGEQPALKPVPALSKAASHAVHIAGWPWQLHGLQCIKQ